MSETSDNTITSLLIVLFVQLSTLKIKLLKEFEEKNSGERRCIMSSSENNLPWLILINPASGTKLAGKMFKSIVKPSLDEKRVHYEVMETEYAGMLSTT